MSTITGGGDKVKVLSMWASGFGWRVLIALKEKGVAFEYQEEDLANKSQLLLSSNPIHTKVPVLLHNGRPVCESTIILQYIDEVWPGSTGLLPKDPHARATARFWVDFVDKKVYNAMFHLIRNVDTQILEQAKQDLIECIITLDSAFNLVANGKPYFGGDSIGFLDIALVPYLSWFLALEEMGRFKVLDQQQCPHLHSWMARVTEHLSVKETLPPPHKLVEYIHQLLLK